MMGETNDWVIGTALTGSIMKYKCGEAVHRGDVVSFNTVGMVVKSNSPTIDKPMSKFKTWIYKVLGKIPPQIPNPEYHGPPTGIAIRDGEIDDDVLVQMNQISVLLR